ncbi:MAG: GAF domain-containing protein [Anaerolineae bacterium]
MVKKSSTHKTLVEAQVLAAIQKIGLARNPQALLEALQDAAVIKDAARTTIILFNPDPDRRAEEASVIATLDSRPNPVDLIGVVYTPQTIPLFWQIDPGQPFIVEDTHADPRLNDHARGILDHLGIHSLVALGLVASDSHLGWLLIENETPRVYNPADLTFLEILTQHLAIALQNQLLRQHTQDSLQDTQTLLTTSRQLFAAETLTGVCRIITRAFVAAGADRCTLSTFTEFDETNRPRQSKIAAIAGSNQQDLTGHLGKTYNLTRYAHLTTVMTGQDILVVTDIPNHPHLNEVERHYLTRIGAETVIVVPIFPHSKDNPLGYLFIEHLTRRPLSAHEQNLYRTLANQATIAIENVQQLENTRQRAKQIQTGAEISKITSSILNRDTLISSAVNLIKEGFGVYYVGLFLVDQAREWAVLHAGSGAEGETQLKAKHRLALNEQSMIGWSIIHKQARIALDVGLDAVRFENPHLPQTRSEMALPLISRDDVLGAITVQSAQPAAFSSDDIVSLQIMADQLANAIANSQLYQTARQTAQQLNTLLDINRDITASTNLDELLNLIIAKATDLINGDQGTIFLAEGDLLIPRAVVGGYAEQMMSIRVRMGEGATGAAAQTRTSVIRLIEQPDAGTQATIPDTPLVPEAIIAVPIQTEARLIGVLLIRRLSISRQFSQAEVDLLEGMALQAAIAVENVTLLVATQKVQQETDTLYRMSRRLSTAETVSQAAEVVAGHVSPTLFDRFVIALKDRPAPPAEPGATIITARDGQGRQLNLAGSRLDAIELPPLSGDDPQEAIIINSFTPPPKLPQQIRAFLTQTLQAQSALILPIKIGPQTLGWLIGGATRRRKSCTPADIPPLLAMADQLGATIDRIQKTESLLESGQQYLAMVDNIPGAVYRSKIDDRYSLIYVSDELFEITGYSAEMLSAGGALALADIIHPDDQKRVWAARQKQLKRKQPYQLQYRIISRDGQVKHISERGRGVFDSHDTLQYLDGIMFDVTEQVSLQQARQRQAAQFEAIAHVGQSATGILNVDRLLAETVELISRSFGFYYAGLFLLDERNEWALLKAGSGEAGRKILAANHRLKRDETSMIGWATYHGKPHVSLNVQQEKHRYDNPQLPDTRSEMALPLISRGKVIGALGVQSVEENAFSEDDIATLQLMANQLANIIENARFFETTQRSLYQANLLYKTTQILLSAKNEDDLFKAFITAMSQVDIDTVSVNAYSGPAQDQYLEVKEIWSFSGQTTYQKGARFNARDSLLFQILHQDETVIIKDTRTDPRLASPEGQQVVKHGVYAMVGIPIIIQGQNLGVVVISSKNPAKTYADYEIRFFESLVQQLVITWQNLRLLVSVERGFRREQIIRQLTGEIHAAVGVDSVLQTTVTGLTRALDAPGGIVRLGAGQKGSKRRPDVPAIPPPGQSENQP